MDLCVVTGHLVAALWRQTYFKTGEHSMILRERQGDIRSRCVQDTQTALEEAMVAAPTLDACRMRWRTKIGAWLAVVPSTVNGTELGDLEWRDALFVCYGTDLPYLTYHWDGYNSKFSIFHSLDCNNRGIINNLHNKLRGGVADLAGTSFTPSNMHNDSLIHQGCAIRERKAHPAV